MVRWRWRRRRIDDETRAEIDSHIELLTDRFVRAGLSPDEARAAAIRQFGNVTWHREEIHMMNGVRFLDELTQDFRHALRQIRHAVGFALAVVATLAVAIGGMTAVFSVAHAVLLAPLPFDEPEKLVRIYQQESAEPDSRNRAMSAPRFLAIREGASFLASVAGTRPVFGGTDSEQTGLDLYRDGQALRLRTLRVTSDYFRTLGGTPFRGPGFSINDEAGTRRVVLSEALWRDRFNADESVIGTTIQLSGEPYEIAGIAPPGLADPFIGDVDIWLPHNTRATRDTTLGSVVARLKDSVSLEQVEAQLTALTQSIKDENDPASSRMVAVDLHEDVVAPSRNLTQLLLAAVALVLLVACINVANLLLVRGTGRVQEFAVRAALGSGRARLIRQIIVETVVLAGLGGMAGLGVAAIGIDVLKDLAQGALPRLDGVGFHPVVLLVAITITMATALACAIIPALRLAGGDPSRPLQQQSRSATGSRQHGRIRTGLAAGQLALALSLLTGAGVLSVTFYRLMNVDTGFRTENVLTFEVNLPSVRYDAARRAAFHEQLAQQMSAIPRVKAAGGTSRLPSAGSINTWPLLIETGSLAGTNVKDSSRREHRTVSGDFFKALGIPLLAGRTFDERDDAAAPMRTIVSANLARIAFPGVPLEDVVGQRIAVLGRKNSREIIGVVGDVTVDVYGTPTAGVYAAHRQFAANRNWALTQVVAVDGPVEQILPAVRAAVARLDPELAIHRAATLSDVVGIGVSRQRLALVLIGTFAVVSLTLAALGLYGVLSYAVRQRTPEIGIRMALGASRAEVRALVFRQAGVVLGIGLVLGTAGALALGRSLNALVFEVSPADPRVLVVTTLLLTVTVCLAAWIPARRAAAVEPKIAMQERC
jgi:predicted permease